MIFSSTSELISTWLLKSVAMRFFFLLSFILFFRFSSGCNFHHFSSIWPSMLQWLLGSLHWCVVVAVFLSFPPFFFFFPSLEAYCCSFFFNPLYCTLFRPMFSRYYACTQASPNFLGLNNIIFSRTWRCRPQKYLRSKSGFFGEISKIITIFLNYVVYSCMLWPEFFLK